MSQNRVPTSEKQKPVPMEEPLKKHGDKMDVGRLGGAEKEDGSNPIGGAGEPQTTPLEPVRGSPMIVGFIARAILAATPRVIRHADRRDGPLPLSLSASPLLFGGVGDLHSPVLGGERVGWILQVSQAESDWETGPMSTIRLSVHGPSVHTGK
jgi:hypothetical protein